MLHPDRKRWEARLDRWAGWLAAYQILLLALALILGAGAAAFLLLGVPGTPDSDWGRYADFVFAISTPLMLCLLLWVLLRLLALLRSEVPELRGLLNASLQAAERQSAVIRRQEFDTHFLQLLLLLEHVISNLREPRPGGAGGRQALVALWEAFRTGYRSGQGTDERDSGGLMTVSAYCVEFFDRHGDWVSPYFSILASVMQWVDRAPEAEIPGYLRTLHGLLSGPELSLAFYVCLARVGDEDLHRLSRRHGLFEPLELVEVLEPGHRKLFC